MGQTQSIFIYSPLDFVEYKDKHPNEPKKLESFLCSALHRQYNIISNKSWDRFIEIMIHKIRCVSEGWAVLPKIHFEVVKLDDGSYIPKVLKVSDAV